MKKVRIQKFATQFLYGPYVDGSQLKARYELADLAVNLVRLLPEGKQKLYYVSVITTLDNNGAYGLFFSGDNKHSLSGLKPPVTNAEGITFQGNIDPSGLSQDKINLIPGKVLNDLFPGASIQIGDTIHINVDKTLASFDKADPLIYNYNVLKEIAKTILHEATHAKDFEETGTTSEDTAKASEQRLEAIIESRKDEIMQTLKRRLNIPDQPQAQNINTSGITTEV